MTSLRTLLIANRGEIAVRIARTARAMGLRTVAVYSDADADASHVSAADAAVRLGPGPAAESYLDIDKVIAAAREAGADAVHPGYGFLSENADFARACADADLIFVGPPAEAIEAMGDKAAAKRLMIAAGVPCVPGYEGEDQADDILVEQAKTIGFPLMVKAVAGGGGRGMRRVAKAKDLKAALASARSEAMNAFGSDVVLLEKAVEDARHVEVQVFADAHGNVIHLGERDCSMQRRHQKVIEEAPSPAVDAALRAKMGAAAVAAAKAVDYRGAGTVEFLLAPSGEFYFLEMNTRLQVEHPVTELVTWLDLVEWQLRVAQGEALPLTQDAVKLEGHAIEARLYAEDPAQGFLPQTGRVEHFAAAASARTDTGVASGSDVSAFYDPMLAKVIVHGATRDEAIAKLDHALGATRLLGVGTNRAFLRACLTDAGFAAGQATTTYLETRLDALAVAPTPTPRHLAMSALLTMARGADMSRAWASRAGFAWPFEFAAPGEEDGVRVEIEPARGGGFIAHVGDVALDVSSVNVAGDATATFDIDGVRCAVHFAWRGATLFLSDADVDLALVDVLRVPALRDGAGEPGEARAPLTGMVRAVKVGEGDAVVAGDLLVVVEAMKMEHEVRAGAAGTVKAVNTREGAQVDEGALLIEIEALEIVEEG